MNKEEEWPRFYFTNWISHDHHHDVKLFSAKSLDKHTPEIVTLHHNLLLIFHLIHEGWRLHIRCYIMRAKNLMGLFYAGPCTGSLKQTFAWILRQIYPRFNRIKMKVQSKQRMYFPVKFLGTKSVFIGVKTPRIVCLYIFLSSASTCQTLMINLSSFIIEFHFSEFFL